MTDELVGRTLADYLDEHGKLPLGEGLALLDALLACVGQAHRANVADGSLHPGRVVVTGLGCVQMLPAEEVSLPSDAALYQSPQQAKGETLDVRADVYALGVIAYRMLMGAAPYGSSEEPVDPHEHLPNLTERVRRSLMIAVQRNLTERFGDALTFRAALRGQSDLALQSPTLRWAVAEGIPEGDQGAADEFAQSEPALDGGTEDAPGW